MSVFDAVDYDGHAEVHFFHDRASGLRAIIAVHRRLGAIAGGGIRMWPYATPSEALGDVLRLSRVMTYKLALADIPIGSAKSVIIGDPRKDKTPALLHAFGRAVESLGGSYFCAEDVGIGAEDLAVIHEVTAHVVGLPGQDPSPATGRGVFVAIRAAVRHHLGREDLAGVRVAVQGVGDVGYALCRNLHEAGAQLYVSDLVAERLQRVKDEFGATIVSPDEILSADVDVFAPCAMGEVLSSTSIPGLRARIVCGGANNALARPELADMLHRRGVLFVPDYLSNSGGVMAVAATREAWEPARLRHAVEALDATCAEAFALAQSTDTPVSIVVDRMTEERISRRWPSN